MLSNYLKIAWKVLLRHPFYTFITLFGISLTLTVLMVLTAFIDHLVGSHYPEMKRYRTLYIERMEQSAQDATNSGPMSFRFLTEHTRPLQTPERVTLFSLGHSTNAYAGGQKIKLDIGFTDAEFWRVTEFEFLQGKPFNEQNIANGDLVAVITDSFRKAYFDDLDESVVGKTVEIENIRYRVIGVVRGSALTRLFSFSDVYFPYTAPKSNYQNKGMRGSYSAMLLAPTERDLPAMKEEFQARMHRLPVPGVQDGFKYDRIKVPSEAFATLFLDTLTGNSVRTAAFYGAIALVTLMLLGLPAINLVNVNVGRIVERSSEIGIRKAFGAPARTLLWQFIIENVFITFIGGTVALILTVLILYQINRSGWIANIDLRLNAPVFGLSLLICLFFGLLSGVLPAWRMSKLSVTEALKS
jgi:putative ABC transport system permease protein